MSVGWLVLIVVMGMATYRLTRLVTKDDFPPIAVLRNWITGELMWDEEKRQWWYEHERSPWYRHWLGDLISCHWCASGWLSLGLTAAVAWWTPRDASLVDWFLTWIATWAIGAVIADKAG